MSINLKKNEAKLKAAYSDVVSDKSDTNWALFGYEGNSNDLKVVETGEDGWEEMVEELNSGKPMYAFCRVTDPNTKLPKNVLVNWMGEGVPASRKGVCARHVLDMERFFRGAHVTINARSEDDVDEATILEKVSKASGANFSFHKEKARPMPAAGPVGSVYQRARPQQEISAQSRDEFWSRQEKEEEERQKREKRTMAETKKQEELERRKREEEDAKRRDRAAKERAQAIDEQKKREQEAFRREREGREADLQARLKRRDEEVDSELERERRDAERQQVQNRSVSSGVRAKLAGFEKKVDEQRQKPPPPGPKRTRPFQPPQPIAKPEPQYEPEPEPEPQYEPEPEPQYEPEPEPQYEPEPEPQYEPEPEPIPPYEPEPEPEPQYEPEPEPEPVPQYEDQEDVYDDVAEQKIAPGGHDYGQLEDAYYDDTQGFQDTGDAEQIYDDVEQTEQPAPAGEGLTAKTVYDYEAEDDTEISFDVDEIITNIEQIDEGWWRGTRQLDGSYGLFPANYVELI